MVSAPAATLHHHLAQHAIQQHQQQQQQQHHHHQQQQALQQQIQHQLQHEVQQEDESEESHLKDEPQDSDCGDPDDSQVDNEEFIEEEHPDDEEEEEEEEDEEQQQTENEEPYCLSDCETDDEEKQLGTSHVCSTEVRYFTHLLLSTSAEFMAHQTSCPSPGRYVCNLCRKEFSQPKWLQTHMSSHSNWLKVRYERLCHIHCTYFANYLFP